MVFVDFNAESWSIDINRYQQITKDPKMHPASEDFDD